MSARDRLNLLGDRADVLTKYQAAAEEQAEAEARERQAKECEQSGSEAWNAWCDGRINAAIAAEHEFMIEIVGTAIGEERGELHDKIRDALAKLRADFSEKIAELRGELTGRLAALDPRAAKSEFKFANERGGDSGVVDLPNPLRTRELN
jgi:hypothetical protein